LVRIRRLTEACYAGEAAGIRLDIGSRSVTIPTNSSLMLVL
jgi:hypothetical protein